MSRDDIFEIDAEKLVRMQNMHVAFILFDLRTDDEYKAGHVQNAFHLPAAEFLKRLPEQVQKKDLPVIVYDHDGIQSGNMVAEAEKLGYTNIVNLEGGYRAYVALKK